MTTILYILSWILVQLSIHSHVHSSKWSIDITGNEILEEFEPKFEIEKKYVKTLKHMKYRGFELYMSCQERSLAYFYYEAVADTGNYSRVSRFFLDNQLSADCQQLSTDPYPLGWDRGHMVPANHFDHDEISIRQTNYMTNILPQRSKMNRGAWLVTEEIIECLRDTGRMHVYGGPIYREDSLQHLMTHSHGLVRIPYAYWKVIFSSRLGVIAWIIPNDDSATRRRLDDYLVILNEIERQTHVHFTIPHETRAMRTSKPIGSWSIPRHCDKG